MEYRVTIGARQVLLRYTVNAMCAMEDAAGGALDGLMDRQFTATRLLLWGGMLAAEPSLTPEAAGALIGEHLAMGGNLEEIVNFCAEGMRLAGFFGPAAQGAPVAQRASANPAEPAPCAAAL